MTPESNTSQNSWWRVVERDQAVRLITPTPDVARSRLCRNRGWQDHQPQDQVGFVKMWKSHVMDLRFFYAGQRFSPQGSAEKESDEEGSANDTKQSEADELKWRLGLALQAPPELLLRAKGPLAWPHTFFGYQQEGIHALLETPHLLLADEMGLGKTVMCIAALRVLLHRREVERNLIVVPASLLEQWRRELRKWAPELLIMIISGAPQERRFQWRYRAHITLVSYETLRADWDETENENTWSPARVAWGVVALDEAQRIKNTETDIALVCKKLSRNKSWALTGTPLENSADDIFSILEFVTGGNRAAPTASSPLLLSSLQHYQLRRRKADVLSQLPPKINTDLVLPLTHAQRRAYDLIQDAGLMELRDGRDLPIENVLALITKLKQICNFDLTGASAKMDDLEERLEEITAAGQKAIVFTQYTNEDNGARRIAARLGKFAPLLYIGDMNAEERSHAIDDFNGDESRKVLVLSLRAGGQGLNLQRASYVFHFDLWWNPAVLQQAEDRTHRLGQSQPVHVYRYLMQDTIEARIADVLQSKTDLFDELVEGVSLDPKQLFPRKVLLQLVGL